MRTYIAVNKETGEVDFTINATYRTVAYGMIRDMQLAAGYKIEDTFKNIYKLVAVELQSITN